MPSSLYSFQAIGIVTWKLTMVLELILLGSKLLSLLPISLMLSMVEACSLPAFVGLTFRNLVMEG